MATTVNYDDKRLMDVEADKKTALSDIEKTYGGMINKAGAFYDKQIDAVEKYGEQQKQIQQQQTDFALEKIEQQKDQAHKDYVREQSGAYTDWQNQSNQYGANAEAAAAQGLSNAGYSESAQVSMYNTYQNRVVAAREVYQRAVLDYDNQMTQARLQNSAALAEIAFNTLKTSLELGLEGFQYQNELIIQKADKKLAVDSEYHSRYMDVLGQINTENALAEEQRQFNEDMKYQKARDAQEYALELKKLEEEKRQFNTLHGGSSGGSSGGGSTSFGSKARKTLLKGAKTAGKAIGSANKKIKKAAKGATDKISSAPKMDMNSILKLGYGPISAKKLDSLMAEGKVISKEKNGKLYFFNS